MTLFYAEYWTEELQRVWDLQDFTVDIWDALELAVGHKRKIKHSIIVTKYTLWLNGQQSQEPG
jgi:hypothetical protein